MNHQGLIKSMRIPYHSGHLINYVHKHFAGQRVIFAYEAGPTGYGLHDQLTAQGYPCMVVSSSMIPTAPGDRVKTNRRDSRKVTEGLRGGQLNSIHVPSESYRQLRHLIQLRDTCVRQAAAAKCRIKALLLFEGIPFPEAPRGHHWSRNVMLQIKNLGCQGATRFKLDQLLASLEFSRKQILDVMREIRRFCNQDPELKRCIEYLVTVPGVGWIVASHLLARLGDWRLIPSARDLASFLGLVPTEHSTGDTVRRGSITRSGDGRLRSKVIQSAWAAIRKDPELREFYRRIFKRHPHPIAARKAIVAVAHKLSNRIYSVLHEQRPYQMRLVNSVPLMEQEIELPQEETRRQAEIGD